MIRFPAEWHPQRAIMLTWPHQDTDWKEDLLEVQKVYTEIAKTVLRFQHLIVSCEDEQTCQSLRPQLEDEASQNGNTVSIFRIPANDTWARDHGPISIVEDGKLTLLDFTFNAWGGKFDHEKDNKITQRLFQLGAFNNARIESIDFILEGGSIESDGQGTLLTTETCLLTDSRNAALTKESIESKLKNMLGLKRILWLKNGYIQGDDTDAHIDTLARFCSHETITYVQCVDKEDDHFEALSKMETELKQFRRADGQPYCLHPLPLPKVYDEHGRRLGATYANFLILNDAVLAPVYGAAEDEEALRILRNCFPDRVIVPINCLALIRQNGSLHCITMQIPQAD